MNPNSYRTGVLSHRCFYLFVSLLVFIVSLPFLDYHAQASIVENLFQLLVLLASVVTLGNTRRSFLIALALMTTTFGFFLAGFFSEQETYLFIYRIFTMLFYVLTIGYLLMYILQHKIMDTDKLFGAASAYLMLGLLWTYLYSLILTLDPGSIEGLNASGAGSAANTGIQLVYFSFTTLTTTGFGDIRPITSPALILAVLEQITGTLFIAILIARLVGVYGTDK